MIADDRREILQQLAVLPSTYMGVTLELSAHVPEDVRNVVVRFITENVSTLYLRTQGFKDH